MSAQKIEPKAESKNKYTGRLATRLKTLRGSLSRKQILNEVKLSSGLIHKVEAGGQISASMLTGYISALRRINRQKWNNDQWDKEIDIIMMLWTEGKFNRKIGIDPESFNKETEISSHAVDSILVAVRDALTKTFNTPKSSEMFCALLKNPHFTRLVPHLAKSLKSDQIGSNQISPMANDENITTPNSSELKGKNLKIEIPQDQVGMETDLT